MRSVVDTVFRTFAGHNTSYNTSELFNRQPGRVSRESWVSSPRMLQRLHNLNLFQIVRYTFIYIKEKIFNGSRLICFEVYPFEGSQIEHRPRDVPESNPHPGTFKHCIPDTSNFHLAGQNLLGIV
jgi:hypothetical protein